MVTNNYKLRYLSSFYEDLSAVVNYINKELNNPDAANRLVDAIDKAILKRKPNAESFEQYITKHERSYPYYRIYVANYVIYYVVIDMGNNNKTMEIRRLLYKKRNPKYLL